MVQPRQVERVFEPALPRPRGLEARRAREFTDTAQAITDIFLARGVLHGAGRSGVQP